ncbi:MAG: DUF4405 domain-containing protein [Candidatus Eremiobacterota bacterium]
MPHGSGGRRFLFLTRHQWGDMHVLFAVIFLIGMIIHFYLHWDWIKKMFYQCCIKTSCKDMEEIQ